MKKMMVALVGIVSVLMLASCHMEVDNDVSLEKTNNQYRMVATGTASCIEAEEDFTAKKWVVKDGAEKRELFVNSGWIEWNDYVNSNQKAYTFDAWYDGITDKGKLNLKDRFSIRDLTEYKEEFYLGGVSSTNKVTVTGSPEDDEFTVSGTVKAYDHWYNEDVLLTLDLTFSR